MSTIVDNKQYFQLKIDGTSSEVEIWLGDDGGHFVQKEEGVLDTSLLPDDYTVEFGLGTQCYPIKLREDTQLTQNEIEAGPTCERPEVDLDS